MSRFSKVLSILTAGAALLPAATPAANAACTRLGFSVNDYGKDGPTRDAQSLLDKYIAKWTGEHGIAKYTTGKKDVSCELFLNFILFDEHTCKAEATVCWDGPAVQNGEQAQAGSASAKPVASKDATGSIDKTAAKTTGKADAKAAAKIAPVKDITPAKDTAKSEAHAAAKAAEPSKDVTPVTGDAPAAKPEVAPQPAAPVKPESQAAAPAAPAVATPAAPAAATSAGTPATTPATSASTPAADTPKLVKPVDPNSPPP